jgi:hypothetical protein
VNIRLVWALLLEKHEEWRLDGRRTFSALLMAKLNNTSKPVQDQLTAEITAAGWPLISYQLTGIEIFTTSRGSTLKTLLW